MDGVRDVEARAAVRVAADPCPRGRVPEDDLHLQGARPAAAALVVDRQTDADDSGDHGLDRGAGLIVRAGDLSRALDHLPEVADLASARRRAAAVQGDGEGRADRLAGHAIDPGDLGRVAAEIEPDEPGLRRAGWIDTPPDDDQAIRGDIVCGLELPPAQVEAEVGLEDVFQAPHAPLRVPDEGLRAVGTRALPDDERSVGVDSVSFARELPAGQVSQTHAPPLRVPE